MVFNIIILGRFIFVWIFLNVVLIDLVEVKFNLIMVYSLFWFLSVLLSVFVFFLECVVVIMWKFLVVNLSVNVLFNF